MLFSITTWPSSFARGILNTRTPTLETDVSWKATKFVSSVDGFEMLELITAAGVTLASRWCVTIVLSLTTASAAGITSTITRSWHMRSLVCRMQVTLLTFRFRIVSLDMLWRNSKRLCLACLTWVSSIAIHLVLNQRNRCGILLTVWKLAKAVKKFRITPSCLPPQLQSPYSLEHYFSSSRSFSSQTCR